LQKRSLVQRDMGVVLKGRLGEDESMFPQSGITLAMDVETLRRRS